MLYIIAGFFGAVIITLGAVLTYIYRLSTRNEQQGFNNLTEMNEITSTVTV